jgi:hypothetical protein
MKRKLLLFIPVIALLGFSSCVVSQRYQITGNPIGTKTGVASSNAVGSGDYGIQAAAKAGKITKIGAVEITQKVFFTLKTTTKVYGE